MTWEDIIDLEKQKDYYKSLEKDIKLLQYFQKNKISLKLFL